MSKTRISLRTLALGAVLIGAFLVMASIFVPDRSQAGEPGELPSQAYSSQSLESMLPLGRLEGKGCSIEVLASDFGPLYNVYDANGRMLAELLTAEQVEARFPGLPLTGAYADVPLDTMDGGRHARP